MIKIINLEHMVLKNGLLISMVLMLLLVSIGAASGHDVSVVRTISPTTVNAGESFDVSLEITVTGPIESSQNCSYATVRECYTAVDDVENWIISNVDAAYPFNSEFKNGNTYGTGLFEFSAGTKLYYATTPYGDSGIYYVNYTMTTSSNAGAGVYSISGYYTDSDFFKTGFKGTTADVTGDSEITVISSSTGSEKTTDSQKVINTAEDDGTSGSETELTEEMEITNANADSGFAVVKDTQSSTSSVESVDEEEREGQLSGFTVLSLVFVILSIMLIFYPRKPTE